VRGKPLRSCTQPRVSAWAGPPPHPSCSHQAYDTRLTVQKEGKYCSLQLTVDTHRNRRCMEEGMLHGLRTRAVGSDAEVTAPRTMGITQSLRPVSTSRTHISNRVEACDHRHAARADAPESWCKKIARILLANLLQRSRSTFSRGSFLSFFAFKEGMWGTSISVLGGWPTVSAR
jgi:hypothetical protein